MTLPLIHALCEAHDGEHRHILKIVRKKRKSRADIQEVNRFVHDRGGIAYAQQRMRDLAREARHLLADFPPTEAHKALDNMVAYTVQRKR